MEPQIKAIFKIVALDDGQVTIHGPIDDLLFVDDVLNAAQKAVIMHHVKKRETNKPNIQVVQKRIIPVNGKVLMGPRKLK